ncbi:MerR family transcriptional regulator [Microlunatus endophyticus]|uniref:MerR family transcriptional regulator n=1 Tax=Microlunatus endophyticus TaxID=1716077 RepID=A0A917S8U6_9ACTN|nr:MerR family transcriptional regulator [Microlunatus endophyticus]GGL62840.1 MerR family transcriptional regulator [Microlunatus endophyticus]
MEDELLTIGVFARRSRLTLRALRLYERLGILSPAVVDPDNGYRRYREDQLLTARMIVGLRRLDMPLSEVARVISASPEVGAEVVERYWAGVERRIASQRELAVRLQEGLRGNESRPSPFRVQERDSAAVIVLSETRAVEVPELRAAISGAITRLSRLAAIHGGAVGGPMILFHGEVNEDSDGPIEVCVPVRTASPATRSEPEHHEAYVTLTKAQWEWPRILSAYDAIDEWIQRTGRRPSGPAREIYPAGFDPTGTASTDEVCDVAVPIG